MTKLYEIRDPIYGFIVYDDWEKDIINHPLFQRLRRIKQLGLTDMVYPGATHTRFEHSLGVMHVATKMFDEIVSRQEAFLKQVLNYTAGGLERDRIIVRIAGLLHDLGHPPFSHAGEGLMMTKPDSDKHYKHEDYSAKIIGLFFKEIIEDHPRNENYKIKAAEVAGFLRGSSAIGRTLLWRDLITSQLDADRADYLLRDSHHIGVAYGRFDLNRLLVTLCVTLNPETETPLLAVREGGLHAAEGLVLARYMMFTQVYFQHTRRAYDCHVSMLLQELLRENQKESTLENKGVYPPPTSIENIEAYLNWCDNKVWGMVISGGGGEHGNTLLNRDHYRRVYETREVPEPNELEIAQNIYDRFHEHGAFLDEAKSSWYKIGDEDIYIVEKDSEDNKPVPLSNLSNLVACLNPINQVRVYTPSAVRGQATEYKHGLTNRGREDVH